LNGQIRNSWQIIVHIFSDLPISVTCAREVTVGGALAIDRCIYVYTLTFFGNK